jgi:hypothetical protein
MRERDRGRRPWQKAGGSIRAVFRSGPLAKMKRTAAADGRAFGKG